VGPSSVLKRVRVTKPMTIELTSLAALGLKAGSRVQIRVLAP